MWERHKRRTWLYILLFILIVAVAVILVQAYLFVTAVDKEKDAQLYNQSQQSMQEIQEVKQQQIDQVDAEYKAQMNVVQQYMPGIVCWGDVLTRGTAGGVSYPDELSQLIENNITKQYDFKSTLEDTSGVSRVDWDSFGFSIPVINMGMGEENTSTILGRAGVTPYVTTREFVIPSNTEPVQIYIDSQDGNHVNPLLQGDPGMNPFTIDGIEGTITPTVSAYKHSQGEYFFTRLTPGAEHTVPEGTAIHTSSDDLYKDYIHVIFMGTYGGFNNGTDLIEKQKAMLARQTKNSDRFIIIGPYTTNYEMYTTNFEQLEALMSQEYGDRFINLRKYFMSDALSDAGLSVTTNDTHEILRGRIPKSLLSAASTIELNATGYKLIGRLVYDRMNRLGYFDEIRDALQIPENAETGLTK